MRGVIVLYLFCEEQLKNSEKYFIYLCVTFKAYKAPLGRSLLQMKWGNSLTNITV